MEPPYAADREERIVGEGNTRGRKRAPVESPSGAAKLDAMVDAAAQMDLENPIGGLPPMAGNLTDSTHMAGTEPATQGVAWPTNGEFWGE